MKTYTPPRVLRNTFITLQQEVAREHNRRGRGVVLRTPSDAALADAAHGGARGMEALARAFTRAIF